MSKVVAIIPARSGSQRIPRKNIKIFHGHPIIAYSIRAAHESGLFDRVIVSTEDDEIAEIAQRYDADVIMRPEDLADDNTGTQAVMRHAMHTCSGAEYGCCIYATAPLLDIESLRAGYQHVKNGAVYAFAVGQYPQLHDAGQFYWGQAWAFRNGAKLIAPHTVMIPIEHERDCDINSSDDWELAEKMYAYLQETV